MCRLVPAWLPLTLTALEINSVILFYHPAAAGDRRQSGHDDSIRCRAPQWQAVHQSDSGVGQSVLSARPLTRSNVSLVDISLLRLKRLSPGYWSPGCNLIVWSPILCRAVQCRSAVMTRLLSAHHGVEFIPPQCCYKLSAITTSSSRQQSLRCSQICYSSRPLRISLWE